jgi:NhaP-type Na+/H+ and K+/H+ antiporter
MGGSRLCFLQARALITTYTKLAALLVLLAVFCWGAIADYSAGKKAGQNSIQAAWDMDKAAIAKVTADAIAQRTAERDMALRANEVIHANYDAQLAANAASAVVFAGRLRDAETRLATNSRSAAETNHLAGSATTSAAASADQFGQLVGLITDLRSECIKNDDQLDTLIAQLKPQL